MSKRDECIEAVARRLIGRAADPEFGEPEYRPALSGKNIAHAIVEVAAEDAETGRAALLYSKLPGFVSDVRQRVSFARDPDAYRAAEEERFEEAGRDVDFTVDPGVEIEALQQAQQRRREEGR